MNKEMIQTIEVDVLGHAETAIRWILDESKLLREENATLKKALEDYRENYQRLQDDLKRLNEKVKKFDDLNAREEKIKERDFAHSVRQVELQESRVHLAELRQILQEVLGAKSN